MDSKQFLEVVEKYKAGFITLPDVMESLAVYTFGEVEKHGEQIAREIEDYAEKNHPKHKSNILWGLPRDSCQRCDITAAYRNAAAIARGEK